MKLLLDTNILLWVAAGTLPKVAEQYILDESNDLFFSPASIWEIVIKRGLSRPDFDVEPHLLYNGLIENGYDELSITSKHTLVSGTLPHIHKDPFDRILLAQSVCEGITLLTSDKKLADYPAPIIYVKKS